MFVENFTKLAHLKSPIVAEQVITKETCLMTMKVAKMRNLSHEGLIQRFYIYMNVLRLDFGMDE